jgi:hypothetical protein
VVLVESGVHLFGVTIGAVPIQGDADMADEVTQTRLVVRSNAFLRVAVCCSRRNAKPYMRARATATGCGPITSSQVGIRAAGPTVSAAKSGVRRKSLPKACPTALEAAIVRARRRRATPRRSSKEIRRCYADGGRLGLAR